MAPFHGPPHVGRAPVDLVRTLENLFDPAHRVERQREIAQVRRELLRRSEEQADRPEDDDEVAGGRAAGDDVAPQPPQHQPGERGEEQRRQCGRHSERDAFRALALGERVEVVDETVDESVGRARQAHRAQLDEGVDGPAGEPLHGHPQVMLGVRCTPASGVPDQPRQWQRCGDCNTEHHRMGQDQNDRERRHPRIRAERHEVRAQTSSDVGHVHRAEHDSGSARVSYTLWGSVAKWRSSFSPTWREMRRCTPPSPTTRARRIIACTAPRPISTRARTASIVESPRGSTRSKTRPSTSGDARRSAAPAAAQLTASTCHAAARATSWRAARCGSTRERRGRSAAVGRYSTT